MQTAQSNSEVLVDPDTLSPETGEPFSRAMTARYLGAFVIFAILNCAAFVLNGNTLMPQHLKDLGYNETEATTALGTITSLTAIVGLLSGYIWGAFSDHTRSRFGKRTPWIFAGSIVAGIGLYLLGSFGDVPSLTASYMLNNLGQGAIQTPMFAILADRVPKPCAARCPQAWAQPRWALLSASSSARCSSDSRIRTWASSSAR